MGFAGSVADAEDLVVGAQSHTGLQGPRGKPAVTAHRAIQRLTNALALAPQHVFDHVARGPAGRSPAQGIQPVGTDATGQRQQLTVCQHHAAITALEGQHRQQTGGQAGAGEIGLEGQQVTAAAGQALHRAFHWQRLPGAMGQDGHRRLQLLQPTARHLADRAPVVAGSTGDRLYQPRLQHRGPGGLRTGQQQAVQGLAAEGAPPGMAGMPSRRQVGRHAVHTPHQRDALQLRP